MKMRRLGKTDLELPTISFSCAESYGFSGGASLDDGLRAVTLAIDHGVNFFDARANDQIASESRLGEILKRLGSRALVGSAITLDRLGSTDTLELQGRITSMIDGVLGRLQRERVDLFTIDLRIPRDAPDAGPRSVEAAHVIPQLMNQLRKSGKVGTWGLRFRGSYEHLKHLLDLNRGTLETVEGDWRRGYQFVHLPLNLFNPTAVEMPTRDFPAFNFRGCLFNADLGGVGVIATDPMTMFPPFASDRIATSALYGRTLSQIEGCDPDDPRCEILNPIIERFDLRSIFEVSIRFTLGPRHNVATILISPTNEKELLAACRAEAAGELPGEALDAVREAWNVFGKRADEIVRHRARALAKGGMPRGFDLKVFEVLVANHVPPEDAIRLVPAAAELARRYPRIGSDEISAIATAAAAKFLESTGIEKKQKKSFVAKLKAGLIFLAGEVIVDILKDGVVDLLVYAHHHVKLLFLSSQPTFAGYGTDTAQAKAQLGLSFDTLDALEVLHDAGGFVLLISTLTPHGRRLAASAEIAVLCKENDDPSPSVDGWLAQKLGDDFMKFISSGIVDSVTRRMSTNSSTE